MINFKNFFSKVNEGLSLVGNNVIVDVNNDLNTDIIKIANNESRIRPHGDGTEFFAYILRIPENYNNMERTDVKTLVFRTLKNVTRTRGFLRRLSKYYGYSNKIEQPYAPMDQDDYNYIIDKAIFRYASILRRKEYNHILNNIDLIITPRSESFHAQDIARRLRNHLLQIRDVPNDILTAYKGIEKITRGEMLRNVSEQLEFFDPILDKIPNRVDSSNFQKMIKICIKHKQEVLQIIQRDYIKEGNWKRKRLKNLAEAIFNFMILGGPRHKNFNEYISMADDIRPIFRNESRENVHADDQKTINYIRVSDELDTLLKNNNNIKTILFVDDNIDLMSTQNAIINLKKEHPILNQKQMHYFFLLKAV